MLDTIRTIIAANARLPVRANSLTDDQDLYDAGLTSFSAVQLMLALEHVFRVEFPDRMLNRRSFTSIKSISDCLHQLEPIAA